MSAYIFCSHGPGATSPPIGPLLSLLSSLRHIPQIAVDGGLWSLLYGAGERKRERAPESAIVRQREICAVPSHPSGANVFCLRHRSVSSGIEGIVPLFEKVRNGFEPRHVGWRRALWFSPAAGSDPSNSAAMAGVLEMTCKTL